MMEEQESVIFTRQVVYASFGQRLLAYIIDGFILAIPNYIIMHLIGGGSLYTDLFIYHTFSPTSAWGELSTTIISWLYMALMESGPGCATPGKMAMGIIVTDTNGNRISFANATGRYFAKIISSIILLVGYFMVLWDDRNQALHDKMAGTIVTKKQLITQY